MKVRDKKFKVLVDVADAECPNRPCYWPRQDPGVFTQGKGYSFRSNDWLCGRREVSGCPHPLPEPTRRKKKVKVAEAIRHLRLTNELIEALNDAPADKLAAAVSKLYSQLWHNKKLVARWEMCFVECRTMVFHTKIHNGLSWTKEGCNEQKDGKWVPYANEKEAFAAIEERKQDRVKFPDPMWATAEYRVVQ